MTPAFRGALLTAYILVSPTRHSRLLQIIHSEPGQLPYLAGDDHSAIYRISYPTGVP